MVCVGWYMIIMRPGSGSDSINTGIVFHPFLNICENFHLGRTTVRAALELLEKGTHPYRERKAASVIFVAGSCQFRENAARYYLPRKGGILDLSEAGKLLFVPLWECALRQWSRERWECILHDLSNIVPGAVPLTVKFYMGVLSSWNNQLILNLFWELLVFTVSLSLQSG